MATAWTRSLFIFICEWFGTLRLPAKSVGSYGVRCRSGVRWLYSHFQRRKDGRGKTWFVMPKHFYLHDSEKDFVYCGRTASALMSDGLKGLSTRESSDV